MMTAKRKIEIFSAGCPVCEELTRSVTEAACPSCDVEVLDMSQPSFAKRAERLGISSVPAVAIDGRLASCCMGRGPDLDTLRGLGLGQRT